MKKNKKGILIFGIIAGACLLVGIIAAALGVGVSTGDDNISGADEIREKYVGVLYVEGIITTGDATYDHEYALDAIDGMIENDRNKALILYINSPGGGVTESDELYLKIKEYKETTGRPVCAYMGNQATSGGYYIAAPADKIIANRNCWTGSIGVTMGNMYDISGLLEKYGIKVTTISSGDNKAMGDMTAPLTKEQKEIFQSIVDEAHDQFVGIVADGRNLDESYVRKIADGRIYTASQAKDIKLIDSIVGTYGDAIEEIQAEFDLADYEVYDFSYEPEYDFLSSLIKSIDKQADSAVSSDLEALAELMEKDGQFKLQYMCEVTK
ncbi:MAG: signal peptide peptidase SppA [Bacillota bacterium]|nr:signal peptide peptidase SppA [Bacillota bacterium]